MCFAQCCEKLKGLTSIISSLGLTIVGFAWKSFENRKQARKELCYKIGAQYYEVIKLVKYLRTEANKVDIECLTRLKRVNSLLSQFNHRMLAFSGNVKLEEVRMLFSEKAAACIEHMEGFFLELDKEGKEKNASEAVCSSKVVSCADCILLEWKKLLEIMARKQRMKPKTLERVFREKYLDC